MPAIVIVDLDTGRLATDNQFQMPAQTFLRERFEVSQRMFGKDQNRKDR
jgi:hypothetical protein